MSKYQLTFNEWDACHSYGDCKDPSSGGWGRGRKPVMNVNWYDAKQYVGWLSKVTGRRYRLLSEAEYEYATRAGTETAYPWGPDITLNGHAMAHCAGCGSGDRIQQTAPVGSYPPNKFDLYDMVGNLYEWVEDCEHPNYEGAPPDGSAWITGDDCNRRESRGGGWNVGANQVRSAKRGRSGQDHSDDYTGFRVARTLTR